MTTHEGMKRTTIKSGFYGRYGEVHASVTQHEHSAGFSVYTVFVSVAHEFSSSTIHETVEAATQRYMAHVYEWTGDAEDGDPNTCKFTGQFHNYEKVCCGPTFNDDGTPFSDDPCDTGECDCDFVDRTDQYEDMEQFAYCNE